MHNYTIYVVMWGLHLTRIMRVFMKLGHLYFGILMNLGRKMCIICANEGDVWPTSDAPISWFGAAIIAKFRELGAIISAKIANYAQKIGVLGAKYGSR